MPSRFPGMDPFIESQEWTDFHTTFITVMREVLTPALRHRYIVRVERRVYVEHATGDSEAIIPDVRIVHRAPSRRSPAKTSVSSTASKGALVPVECVLPMPEEKREAFLVVRERRTHKVVTVMELLSPTNKSRGADGFAAYLSKREEVLQSSAHLVEIDLLRGGERTPTLDPLPPGDYYALVCRRDRRPRADVYAWTVRDPLPNIPVPLAAGDADVLLDLQNVFTITYDRAAYDDSLDYGAPLRPSLSEADATWARQLVESGGSAE